MLNINSIVFNGLIKTSWLTRFPFANRMWRRTWRNAQKHFYGRVSTTIHGTRVLINYGYTYPLNMRLYSSLNNPLVELAFQTSNANRKPVVLVDVGAAIGDTVLLLERNCR